MGLHTVPLGILSNHSFGIFAIFYILYTKDIFYAALEYIGDIGIVIPSTIHSHDECSHLRQLPDGVPLPLVMKSTTPCGFLRRYFISLTQARKYLETYRMFWSTWPTAFV